MYSSASLALKYLRYYTHASNSRGHGMHSPFVFDFILHVLNNGTHYPTPRLLEDFREKLLQDHEWLTIDEHGAGSRIHQQKQRKLSDIARSALKPRKYASLLYRMVRHYQPNTIIELGTSLGLTTAYLSKANPEARIYTIEGSKSIHDKSRAHLAALDCRNVIPMHGLFDELLPGLLSDLPQVDLAYIDGNHRYQPTMNYFEQLMSKVHPYSILVFDDIHWSKEMEMAWQEICADQRVKYTIDVFFLGFVFFRTDFHVKQNFSIRY